MMSTQPAGGNVVTTTTTTKPPISKIQLRERIETIVTQFPPEREWPAEAFQGLSTGPTAIAYLLLISSASHPDVEIFTQPLSDWMKAYITSPRATTTTGEEVGVSNCGLTNETLAHLAVSTAISQDFQHVYAFLSYIPTILEAPGSDDTMYGLKGTVILLRLMRYWCPTSAFLVNPAVREVVEIMSTHACLGARHVDTARFDIRLEGFLERISACVERDRSEEEKLKEDPRRTLLRNVELESLVIPSSLDSPRLMNETEQVLVTAQSPDSAFDQLQVAKMQIIDILSSQNQNVDEAVPVQKVARTLKKKEKSTFQISPFPTSSNGVVRSTPSSQVSTHHLEASGPTTTDRRSLSSGSSSGLPSSKTLYTSTGEGDEIVKKKGLKRIFGRLKPTLLVDDNGRPRYRGVGAGF